MEALLEHGEDLVNNFLCHYNHNHDPNTGQFTSGASSGAIKKANQLYAEAEKHEPQITKDLEDVVDLTNNGRLMGLENKLKSKESLSKKLDSGKDVKDALRYSIVSDDDNLFNDYYSVRESLNTKGYEETKCENDFLKYKVDGYAKYKQLTCNYRTPDKYEFEIEFHSDKSYKVRNRDVNSKRKDRLEKNVKYPSKVLEIPHHDVRYEIESGLSDVYADRYSLREKLKDAKKNKDSERIKILMDGSKYLDNKEKLLMNAAKDYGMKIKHGEDLVNNFLCHYNHNHDPNTGQFSSGAGSSSGNIINLSRKQQKNYNSIKNAGQEYSKTENLNKYTKIAAKFNHETFDPTSSYENMLDRYLNDDGDQGAFNSSLFFALDKGYNPEILKKQYSNLLDKADLISRGKVDGNLEALFFGNKISESFNDKDNIKLAKDWLNKEKQVKHGEDLVNNFLCHYNHNHDPNTGQFSSGPGGPKASKESSESRKHIIKSTDRAEVAQRAASLSDKELQAANNRYNAEQQYIKNMYSPNKGKEYVVNLLKKHGDQFLNTLLQKVEQQVAAELVNAATKALKSTNTETSKPQEQTTVTIPNTSTPQQSQPQQNPKPKKGKKK